MPPPGSPTGIEAVFLANRGRLVRFLVARGAGDAAEDLVHDVWLKVSKPMEGPIGDPLAYLFRAANTLMIDRYRSRRQAELRDQAWADGREDQEPPVDRALMAQQEVAAVAAALAALGARKETVFRRARIDGVPQREIAAELGISVSTVESDLRIACRALVDLQERLR